MDFGVISGSAHCEPLQFPHGPEGQHISNHSIFMCVPKSPKICSRPKHTGNTLPPEAMGRRARPAPRLGEQRAYAAAAREPQDMKAVRAAMALFKPPPALALAGPAHLTTSCSARHGDVMWRARTRPRKLVRISAGPRRIAGPWRVRPSTRPAAAGHAARRAWRRVPYADVGLLELREGF